MNDTGDDKDNDGDQLNYAIIGGNNDGFFTDQATGEIRIAANKQLDFDLPNGKQEHTLTIRASDGANSDTANTVPVSNVNDKQSLDPAQTAQLSEKATAGTEVVDLADDNTKADTDLDGDAIQYSIQKSTAKPIQAISLASISQLVPSP